MELGRQARGLNGLAATTCLLHSRLALTEGGISFDGLLHLKQ